MSTSTAVWTIIFLALFFVFGTPSIENWVRSRRNK